MPGIAGSTSGTGSVTDEPLVPGVAVSTTTSVVEPENEDAPGADACPVTCSSSPRLAWAFTGTVASSSSACPTARLPTLQVAPLADGQTVNLSAPRSGAAATWPFTTTPVLAALVLHTQITKLAVVPAWTSGAEDSDCTRTQSCGVIWPAGGDVGDVLGDGDGLVGVLELALGSGLALGEEDGDVDDELSVGDAVGVSLGDGLELSVGDGEGVSVGDGDGVSVGDGLELSVGDAAVVSVGDGDGVSVGDALELSLGDVVGVSAGINAAVSTAVVPAGFPAVFTAVSNAVFGSDEQVVLGGEGGAVTARAASDSPNAVKPRMVNPATVPSATRLRVCSLTRATSFPSGSSGSRYLPYISFAHTIRAGAEGSSLRALDGQSSPNRRRVQMPTAAADRR